MTMGLLAEILATRGTRQAHDLESMQRLLTRARRFGRFSRSLGGHYAERLWFTPWPTPMGPAAAEREARWLAETEPLKVPFAGRMLDGFTAGSGPAVLLIHGWGEHAARLGAYVRPLRAAGLRAVGVTMPAHGPAAAGTTNVYEMSRAIVAAAATAGGVDAIIAHSMGVTASALALRDGLACRALVALAVPTMRTEDAFTIFGKMLALPPRTAAGLRAAIERRFGPGTWEDVAAALGRNPGIPALVVHDHNDALVPLDDAQAVANAWAVPLHTTKELGHRHILRDPGVVDQVVTFISGALQSDSLAS
jgi:pimeloyl-ACP methyl ester carboxylesterase